MKDELNNSIEKIKKNKLIKEFINFISQGNVIDLAIGVIIGSAFGKIVTSVVNDILMPIIGAILGGHDFTSLRITFGSSSIMIGNFVQNVVDFFIIAICIFFFIQIINKIIPKKQEEKVQPQKNEETKLLEEIRDLLKEQKKVSKTTKIKSKKETK